MSILHRKCKHDWIYRTQVVHFVSVQFRFCEDCYELQVRKHRRLFTDQWVTISPGCPEDLINGED